MRVARFDLLHMRTIIFYIHGWMLLEPYFRSIVHCIYAHFNTKQCKHTIFSFKFWLFYFRSRIFRSFCVKRMLPAAFHFIHGDSTKQIVSVAVAQSSYTHLLTHERKVDGNKMPMHEWKETYEKEVAEKLEKKNYGPLPQSCWKQESGNNNSEQHQKSNALWKRVNK